MLANIETILDEISRGRMIVLVDDEDRENEGDLVIPACFITPDIINFMAQHARGLICLTLTKAHCEQLQLPLMTAANEAAFATNFTVSIEAARGVTTGISAADRATTILAASNPTAQPHDIVRPGHIFPVQAQAGGVLVRAGHTEAACDLVALARLYPAAVICEIMNADGTMARLPDLTAFAQKHGLQIGSIQSLIEYRLKNERLIERVHTTTAQTVFGAFQLTTYRDSINHRIHIALYRGVVDADAPVLVRVTINPTILEGVLTEPPPASWGVAPALEAIAQADAGILLLLAAADADEDKLLRQCGMVEDAPPAASGGRLRQYGLGAQILRDLGAGKVRLLSGPLRIPSLEGFGLQIDQIIHR